MRTQLFQPGRIGTMQIRNRTVMAPMGTNLCDEEGYVTQRLMDYYEARAAGGVGLVIVEGSCLDTVNARAAHRQVVIDADRFIPGLKRLAQAIHRPGAKAGIQLFHAGVAALPRLTPRPWAPSPQTFPDGRQTYPLTLGDISQVIELFVRAALRAREAGFDGVEVHGAHRYLLSAFFSPSSNFRTDGYGGDEKGRARIAVEIIQAVKQACGKDYPVWLRMNGVELMPQGLTSPQAVALAGQCEEAGADAIHISAWGVRHQAQQASLPTVVGGLLPYAAAVKKAVRRPVIAVGRMNPQTGEAALEGGQADFIAFGRGLIADPELVNKAAQGREADIRPCIACMTCRDGLLQGKDIQCEVNPVAGREGEYRLRPAEKPKQVLVVGGGVAGMEAALTAAQRGHQVTLWEQGPRLGGQLIQASLPPHKERLQSLLPYYETQLQKAGVRVELGRKADAPSVKASQPWAVVVGVGVKPFIPDIPGIKRPSVVLAGEVLEGRAQVGKRVVVLGGEMVGCETAELLADQGRQVTVTRRGERMAQKVTPSMRELLLDRLAQKGVRLLTGVSYEEVTDKGLVVTVKGERQLLEADTIVLAAGSLPDQALARELEGAGLPIHIVGDCREPRGFKEAIAEGFQAGRQI